KASGNQKKAEGSKDTSRNTSSISCSPERRRLGLLFFLRMATVRRKRCYSAHNLRFTHTYIGTLQFDLATLIPSYDSKNSHWYLGTFPFIYCRGYIRIDRL